MVRLCTALNPVLNSEVIRLLSQNYILTVHDFLSENVSKLSNITKLNFKVILILQKELICQFGSKPICCRNLLSVKSKTLMTGIESIDTFLKGGLPIRKLIEICGLAGSGKTRICHKIVSNILQANNSKVVYFDTKGDFSSSKIAYNLEKAEYPKEVLASVLNRIIVVKVWTMYELINSLHTFRTQGSSLNICLFVIDSLPALTLQFLGDKNREVYLGLLNEFSNVARFLCNLTNSPMIVVNIQTRWMQIAETEDDNPVCLDPLWYEKRTRCLGKYWQHIPSVVIELDESSDKNLTKISISNVNFKCGEKGIYEIDF